MLSNSWNNRKLCLTRKSRCYEFHLVRSNGWWGGPAPHLWNSHQILLTNFLKQTGLKRVQEHIFSRAVDNEICSSQAAFRGGQKQWVCRNALWMPMLNTNMFKNHDLCSKCHNMQFQSQRLDNIKIRNKYGLFITVIMPLQLLAWLTLIILCKNVFCILHVHERQS